MKYRDPKPKIVNGPLTPHPLGYSTRVHQCQKSKQKTEEEMTLDIWSWSLERRTPACSVIELRHESHISQTYLRRVHTEYKTDRNHERKNISETY